MVLQAENLLEWKSRRKKSCRCDLSPSTPLPPRSVEVFKLISFMRKRLNAFPSTNKEAGRSESPCMLKSSIEFIRVVSFFIWSDCIIKIKTKSIIEKLINDIEPPPARIWLVISASNQMRLIIFRQIYNKGGKSSTLRKLFFKAFPIHNDELDTGVHFWVRKLSFTIF